MTDSRDKYAMLLRPGTGGVLFSEFRERGIVAVGWTRLDEDIQHYRDEAALRRQLEEAYSDRGGLERWVVSPFLDYCFRLHIGAPIVIGTARTGYLLGRVSGPYHYDPNSRLAAAGNETYRHIWPVDWERYVPRAELEAEWAKDALDQQGTLFWLTEQEWTVLEDQALAVEQSEELRTDWTREELLLALDLFLKVGGVAPEGSPEITALSDLLRAASPRCATDSSYRSVHAVWLQLREFEYVASGGEHGFNAVARLDRDVFEEFGLHPDGVAALAAEIREDIGGRSVEDPAEQAMEFAEGRVAYRLHAVRERNADVVRKKKAGVRREERRLVCEACGFDYGQAYAVPGSGDFIECHHDKPISTYSPGQNTRVEDLRLVCANCHRMLHLRRPWLTVDELRRMVAECPS